MSQTLAILMDAYRELNARKMFWITLIISGLFMALFALLGAEDDKLTFATSEWPMPHAKTVYKSILKIALVSVWLSWAAVILALISTASIFPDFMASGSIDLYLARPISRLRLFLTKYLSALLFVLLQATIFSIGAFFVVGLRAGEWKPSLFLAIPLITIFYSYLYAICVLLGVWTRSAIASMLLTILIWFGIFGVHVAENFTLTRLMVGQAYVDIQQQRIADADARLTAMGGPATASSTAPAETESQESSSVGDSNEASSANIRRSRDRAVAAMQDRQASLKTMKTWHTAFYVAMSILPKTGETVALLDRELFERDEMEKLMSDAAERRRGRRSRITDEDFQVEFEATLEGSRRTEAEILSRSPLWVIGTSLVFEAVVLAFAAWIFCRRDY